RRRHTLTSSSYSDVSLTSYLTFFVILSRHPRAGGDPVFQSIRDLLSEAAAYWMPAFAGMTAENGAAASFHLHPPDTGHRPSCLSGWGVRRSLLVVLPSLPP